MAGQRLTLAEINALDADAFVDRLGSLYEGDPWMVAEAWHARPFADAADLERALDDVVRRAPEERQVALIEAHPDLVGRAALAGTLTRDSTAEQAAAGLDPLRLTPDEIATFDEFNTAYRARFGFPFVICARENRKESILAGFACRLDHSRAREIATALDEIAKIAHYRLLDVLE
jgi:OHCU decarboxylase